MNRPLRPARAAAPTAPTPRPGTLAHDVLVGLSAVPKSLPSMHFYDDRGSALFQRIMKLPEYYLSRAEDALLHARGAELARALAPDARALDLFELGSGDGRKTLALCRALQDAGKVCTYHPMDIAPAALRSLARRFRRELPQQPVQPLCGDYFQTWPITRADRRQAALFMGSNLGNFPPDEALRFLARVRAHLRPGDALLLGLDLVKNPHTVLAAYNDRRGVTARFNLNLLRRLNEELGMDFDLARFRHYPTYCPSEGVARSYLVSQGAQVVHSRALERSFGFADGETLYTEQSQKYTPAGIEAMAAQAGFLAEQLMVGDPGYGLALWRVPARVGAA